MHPDTSGNGAAERQAGRQAGGHSSACPLWTGISTPPPHPLTMHAACTASERLAALGSHQNMWQQKEAGPAAMINANVWTSLPTARKERKRTRHSPSTASVWRDSGGVQGNQLERKQPDHLGPTGHVHLTALLFHHPHPSPLHGKAQPCLLACQVFTCWCKMVRVAGATLT